MAINLNVQSAVISFQVNYTVDTNGNSIASSIAGNAGTISANLLDSVHQISTSGSGNVNTIGFSISLADAQTLITNSLTALITTNASAINPVK